MTHRQLLEIPFSSGRAGSGPATWGQRAFWDTVRRLDPADAPRYNLATAAPLDPGLPLPVLLDALGRLLHLHDSLHTRLLPTRLPPTAEADLPLRQVVDPTGALTLEVEHCPAGADPAGAGERLHRELAARTFDTATEWPIRVGVVESGGLARHITLVLSHTAVDGAGLNRLVADLTALCLGTPAAELTAGRSPARQPLEEAGFQASERGRKRDAAARAQFLRKLRSGPARLFPGAEHATGAAEPFPNAVLRSPALPGAVERVAAAHRASSSSVLLAATAALTARAAGTPDAVLSVVVNNRFLPDLADAVSAVAGQALLHLPDATAEFGDLVRRTHAAALGAYRHAYYDGLALAAEIERLTAEGVPLADRSCVFNDVRTVLPAGGPDPAGEPAGEPTTLTWPVEFEPRPGLSYALDVRHSAAALSLAMTADPAVLPRPEMARFLYGVEELILAEDRRRNA
ncbi:condensation domain-containing protein [Streptomyces sp. Y1]|uniref:Condensation domain-containing protein n=1 Tax=Streptomyces sp. Y1 TaxID=3238634 RepID=A0AB39TSQ0_9ACTN